MIEQCRTTALGAYARPTVITFVLERKKERKEKMHPAVPQLNIFKVHAGNDATQQESNESLASAAAAASSKSARGPGGPHSARGTTGIASVALSGRGWDSQTARTRSYAGQPRESLSAFSKALVMAVACTGLTGVLVAGLQLVQGRSAALIESFCRWSAATLCVSMTR